MSRRPWKATHRKGRWYAKCPLGLWAVDGPDRESVERDAAHYWSQYAADGEYEAAEAEERGS
jgi:hypothetical protein